MKLLLIFLVSLTCFSSVYWLSPKVPEKGTISYYEIIQDHKTKEFYDNKYIMKLISDWKWWYSQERINIIDWTWFSRIKLSSSLWKIYWSFDILVYDDEKLVKTFKIDDKVFNKTYLFLYNLNLGKNWEPKKYTFTLSSDYYKDINWILHVTPTYSKWSQLQILKLSRPVKLLENEINLSNDLKSRINLYNDTLVTLENRLSNNLINSSQFDFLSVRIESYIFNFYTTYLEVKTGLSDKLNIELINYNKIYWSNVNKNVNKNVDINADTDKQNLNVNNLDTESNDKPNVFNKKAHLEGVYKKLDYTLSKFDKKLNGKSNEYKISIYKKLKLKLNSMNDKYKESEKKDIIDYLIFSVNEKYTSLLNY